MPSAPTDEPTDELVEALDSGVAYAELTDVAMTLVNGADARTWLNDLVTTDVETLERLGSRPSLLLTPTGRIRASFHVLGAGRGAFFLAQRSDEPDAIGGLLAPYVLSSDVTLAEVPVRIFAMPGREDAPGDIAGAHGPSILGGGIDVVIGSDDEEPLEAVRARLAAAGLAAVPLEAVEARRVRRGDPRFPVDLGLDALPAEAGWDAAPVTDRAKGCFLGQESVAKVANLGHPTRIIRPVRAEGPVEAGDPVLLGADTVGFVTSAEHDLALVRVSWPARDGELVTASGVPLRAR